jgi:nitronate monooxygenase
MPARRAAPRGFDQDRLLAHQDLWSAGHSVAGVHDIVDVATLIERTRREYSDARARTLENLTGEVGH